MLSTTAKPQGTRRGRFSSVTVKKAPSTEKYDVVKQPKYLSYHAVAHFQRNEIHTGLILPLMDSLHFEFLDVNGIETLDNPDSTDFTDFSANDDYEHHHRTTPEWGKVSDEEEQARAIVQGYSKIPTGKTTAFNRSLHKYMLKQLHSKSDHRTQAMAHLAHETKLFRKLTHTNLLTLRGTPSFGDQSLFLLVDRISETLAQRLQRWRSQANPQKVWFQKKTIPKAQVDPSSKDFRTKLGYAQDLASVLAYLHSKNIVVRNLSPESIGFSASDDTLQLMDLGQARAENAVSQKPTPQLLWQQEPLFQMTCGGMPFRYMAPELLASNTKCSKTVDSYSWAMIALELVTLHQPFGKMKAGQHLKQVVLRKPSLRPHLEVYQLPKAIETLLTTAWREDASQRWEAAQIDLRLQNILQKELYDDPSGRSISFQQR